MTTIRLKVKRSRDFRVEAKTIPSGKDQPDQSDGNIELPGGAKIKWDAELGGNSTVSKYTVEFRHLTNAGLVWPFVEKADGTGVAPPDYTGPLVLPYVLNGEKRDNVELTTKSGGVTAKYTVTAEPSDKIDALDPMIIIRPQFAAVNVAFGVSCAVLGAVAGALLTAWLL